MTYIAKGYQRWPGNWPPAVPAWQRWPQSAPKTAAWPTEWLGRQTAAVGFPNGGMPGQVACNFLNFAVGTTRWFMEPSLLGPNSTTFVAKAITGTIDQPTGIITKLELVGPNDEDWIVHDNILEYEIPYNYDRNYQAERFFMRIGSTKVPSEGWAIYEFFTSNCGREWNIDFPS